MYKYYFIYDTNINSFLGRSRVKINGDNIECREVTKEQYEKYTEDEWLEIVIQRKQINELENIIK